MAEGPVDQILEALRERAKELTCLYRVHEITRQQDASLDEICRALLEIIPPGWQYPEICRARITLENTVYEPPRVAAAPWVQRADIVVQDEPAGSLEVFYSEPRPAADEGPFLKEERKLIDTIAGHLGHLVAERRLRRALQGAPDAGRAARAQPEWWVISEFLRKTDPQLLSRIARRLVNHLSWQGIAEAQALLLRAGRPALSADDGAGDNRPMERQAGAEPDALIDEALRVAAGHLSEQEIVACIEKWMRDDKVAFLVEAVENQGTTLAEIAEALQRYQQFAARDRQLSRPVQVGLRVALARRLLSDDLDFINRAKGYLDVEDFSEIVRRVVAPKDGHGRLGGKSAGLLLAAQVVRKSPEYADTLGDVKIPRTWYVTSDGLLSFVAHNHLEDVYNWKYLEAEQIRREYPHLVQVFKHSHFPPELVRGLSQALDDLEGGPIIVRSSSLLEDRIGAAFSGKYKSLFLANQGTKAERLAGLLDAIAEVYASVFGPDPVEYRAARGLLDVHEEMGVMIQSVVGVRLGPYFLPAFAGVAFSTNEVRWSPRIRREDGLLRLVPGLGTRAVDRLSDDYSVLVAPGQPGLRANVAPDEIARYAPRRADVIDLEGRRFTTIQVSDLLARHGHEYPALPLVASVAGEDGVFRPAGFGWDPAQGHTVVTFDGLVSQTSFVARIRALLRLLRERLGGPVDIEFASDGRDFYLLQCRPQSFAEDAQPAVIPRNLPPDRLVFTANRYVSNGRIPDITHVVFVDPDAYSALGTEAELREVGRIVGRLNKLLPRRQFILVGPGRWGSRGDIRLGVSVTYADINNTAMLVEVATRRGGYLPELSFGTHFFQDLVESAIRYLPLFPDDPDVVFNQEWLRATPGVLADLLPEAAGFAPVVRVIDVPRATGGRVLRVLLNAELDEAVGALLPPAAVVEAVRVERRAELLPQEEHWRWRLRMAERIAAEADFDRFGLEAIYLLGSVKNATADAGSDIDLLLHVRGTPEQRLALEHWLEGWSLCLGEMNFLRTGSRTRELIDAHFATDADVAERTGYAAKIGAVTDAARLLRVISPS
jgi:pyruvate, water dikinase